MGGQKPQAFLRRALWNVSALEMAVKPADDGEVIAQWGFPDERQSWSWDEPKRLMQVHLYSTRCACVFVALNGRNVSEGCVSVSRATDYTATVKVPYEPGTLEATGVDAHGRVLATQTFQTAGAPAQLRLTADRTALTASRADLSYVVAEVVDSAGVLVTCANESVHAACVPPTIRFEIDGPGEIAAVGSGDPIDPGSFYAVDADGAMPRRSYRGRATAIVRPGQGPAAAGKPAGHLRSPEAGILTITAKAAGLTSATLVLQVGSGSGI